MAVKIQVINGPNLNLLGVREKDIYGTVNLGEIEAEIARLAEQLKCQVRFFQSNHEGEIIDCIHTCRSQVDDSLIPPPTRYLCHQGCSSRGGAASGEVHMSNIYQRELFRHQSVTAPVCRGQIAGFGVDSYLLGLRGLVNIINGL